LYLKKKEKKKEYSHQSGQIFPSILHYKPTFSILHYHISKTPTSVYLFYKSILLK